jgi:hypothetical protein
MEPLKAVASKILPTIARTPATTLRTPGPASGPVNLSERGIYFRSRQRVNVGEPLEMYFTIPRELTGRSAEQVRCSARVVHVEPQADRQGLVGVGAAVERFEPMSSARDWGN